MDLGPVEWIAISFPGGSISNDVIPAIAKLVESGTVHIIDLLILRKDPSGDVAVEELSDLRAEELAVFDTLDGDVLGLLSEDDFPAVAEELAPGSTALVIVWENLWAVELATAVHASGGELLTHDRIPRHVIDVAAGALTTEEIIT